MHIFMDESGNFSGIGSDQPAISTLGVLIIPTHKLPRLYKRYRRIRNSLPTRKGEVKGSLLNEQQFIEVIDLLRKNNAIFCSSMIDMAEHQSEDIERHRDDAIAALSKNLTDGHTVELRENVENLQTRMKSFSVPLYTQLIVTFNLLHRAMGEMILYHCQRNPKELESFHWVIDAKQSNNISNWEDWWSKTVIVWLQAKSISSPTMFLESGNYRYFQRFLLEDVPNYLKNHVKKSDPSRPAGVDLQMMFREHFSFSSEPLPGLELVDIATNGLRRALVNNLREEAWIKLRDLMINRVEGSVCPVALYSDNRTVPKDYSDVLLKLKRGNRSMFTSKRT